MNTEYTLNDEFAIDTGKGYVTIHERELLGCRARLAVVLIERWGLVSADPDGEDSAGRARAKLMNPADVVARACDVSDAAFREFATRDWLTLLPSLDELMEGVKAKEAERRQSKRAPA